MRRQGDTSQCDKSWSLPTNDDPGPPRIHKLSLTDRCCASLLSVLPSMRISFLCFLSICTLVAAAPSRRGSNVVHEKRAAEPVAWAKTRRLEAHKVIPLRIGLAQQNILQLEELLMSVSHPNSPTFGQHWS